MNPNFFLSSFHFLTERHEETDEAASSSSNNNDDDVRPSQRLRLVQSHRLARGVGPMKNYGIDFAKTTAMPEEVLRRAEELAAIVGKGDEVALLAAVTFIKIFFRP